MLQSNLAQLSLYEISACEKWFYTVTKEEMKSQTLKQSRIIRRTNQNKTERSKKSVWGIKFQTIETKNNLVVGNSIATEKISIELYTKLRIVFWKNCN